MNRIEHYLSRIALREARRPRLEDALITRRGGAYATYRLRFLFLRTFLRAALHLVEILILMPLLADGLLLPVLGVRVAVMIGAALWWGGLEELRESVRACERKGERTGAAVKIEIWLSVSSVVGFATTSLLAVALLATSKADTISAMDLEAYVLACVFRLAIECVVRTYHSGIFALQRIRRPLWSLIVVDVLDVALILILWGQGFLFWSLSISLVSVGMIKAGLLFWFVRSAHQNSPVPRLRTQKILFSFLRLQPREILSFLKNAFSNLISQLDSLLLIALISVSSKSESGVMLAVTVYLLRPFLAAGQSALRIFYFDLIKLRDRFNLFLRDRFDRFMKRTALVTTLILNAMSLVWTATIIPFAWNAPTGDPFRVDLILFAAVLIPFSGARIWFGWRQTQAFAWGNHRYILKLTAIIASGSLLLFLLMESGPVLLLSTAALISGALWIVKIPEIRDDLRPEHRAVSLPRFLAEFGSLSNIQLGVARVDTRVSSVDRVFQVLLNRFPHIVLSRLDRSAFLWKSHEEISLPLLARQCSGALKTVEILSSAASKTIAMQGLFKLPFFAQRGFENSSNPAGDSHQLSQVFCRQFSTGHTITVARGALGMPENDPPLQSSVRRVLRTISKSSFSGLVRRFDLGEFDMTVFCPRGEPETIFLIPTTVPVTERVIWAEEVFRASLAASIQKIAESD